MNPLELLPGKIAELVHELSVLPYNNMEGHVTSPWTLTNYVVWGLIALVTTMIMFIVVANREKKQIALAAQSGDVTALAPAGRLVGALEAGVEFIRDMATDVIGPKDGPKYVPLLGTFFFMILISNMFGLIPAGKSIGGTIGGTVALALISWLAFVWIGFSKNGAYGYLKSLIPEGVRQMPPAGRIILGGFIFLLEFISYFIVRPLTLAVRLFANLYAGHIILGVFSGFVALFWPIFEKDLAWSIGGVGAGALALVFLILMYAFEVFVAFIQAYVFTILTAVYIQSSVHASEH
ncbi:MAG: F0F1 ATP synthase subunit A [Coriobacteriia bacterium]|nr:F0F1 ATP synthase subunit A [Coriobacteriia bacterium]